MYLFIHLFCCLYARFCCLSCETRRDLDEVARTSHTQSSLDPACLCGRTQICLSLSTFPRGLTNMQFFKSSSRKMFWGAVGVISTPNFRSHRSPRPAVNRTAAVRYSKLFLRTRACHAACYHGLVFVVKWVLRWSAASAGAVSTLPSSSSSSSRPLPAWRSLRHHPHSALALPHIFLMT